MERNAGVATVLQAGAPVAVCTTNRVVFLQAIMAMPSDHPDRRRAEVKALIAMTLLRTDPGPYDDELAEQTTRLLLDEDDA
jgi:hypothetical protein